ncbi:uncharacterized protein LOC112092581 [Morus notabilis]|uniref:uncharacterized protein LOC112092581 n=1 Tax=Morus notabilis TaxID=981085 RepID=UPI000CED0AB9|nr:uncharacterized protein LOC112092581 [Morus notabilis]
MAKYGMAADRGSSTSEFTSSQETPMAGINGGSDSSGVLPITSHKLNGHNYLQWSQSVLMFVRGKGNDDHLTGLSTSPGEKDPKYRSWRAEDSMVMSWLINSMINDIGENFLLYSTAKEIWDATKDTYSSKENTSELFGVETILHDLRQGETSLDLFEEYTWESPSDGNRYRQIIEKKRVFKFLMGLNKDLDEVRGRILGTKPLPSLREAFSEVRREESRKKVMLGTLNNQPTAAATEGSALAVRGPQLNNTENKVRRGGRPRCEHCRKTGHTRDTCWKIHGKPTDWKPSRSTTESRGNIASSASENNTSEPILFSKEWL